MLARENHRRWPTHPWRSGTAITITGHITPQIFKRHAQSHVFRIDIRLEQSTVGFAQVICKVHWIPATRPRQAQHDHAMFLVGGKSHENLNIQDIVWYGDPTFKIYKTIVLT